MSFLSSIVDVEILNVTKPSLVIFVELNSTTLSVEFSDTLIILQCSLSFALTCDYEENKLQINVILTYENLHTYNPVLINITILLCKLSHVYS